MKCYCHLFLQLNPASMSDTFFKLKNGKGNMWWLMDIVYMSVKKASDLIKARRGAYKLYVKLYKS